MKLIGVLGKKRHGKDTISDFLHEEYEYERLTIAAPLKEACRHLFGFDDDQLYGDKKDVMDEFWGCRPRDTYQFIGTDVFRNNIEKIIPGMGSNFWITRVEKAIHDSTSDNIVITDLRFQNEVDMIKRLGGTVIKVHRPGIINEENHCSEAGIDNIKNYDHLVVNDSTIGDLNRKILNIVESNNLQ